MTADQDNRAVTYLLSHRKTPFPVSFDGKFALWRTDSGDWWSPPVNLEFLDKMINEILMDVYGAGDDLSGSVVIDCGANIGVFAKYALDRRAARVICCEPAPDTLAALERNLHDGVVNGRISVIPKAVWSEPGTARFAMTADDPGSNQIVQAANVRGAETSIEVETTTIDAVVDELKLPAVDLIKLDIEGAESAAIHGAAETIRRFRPRIAIATEHTGDVPANNKQVLQALDDVSEGYLTRCMECHAERSASFGGLVLTPYVLLSESCPTRAG